MAEELAKLRTKFVKTVSCEIVKQLLDNLLDDRVINDGEREDIIENNKTTTDKARQLIDTVKKKGDKASNCLIHHLQECDKTLYEELCQSCGVTVKYDVQETQVHSQVQQGSQVQQETQVHSQVPQESQNWSSTLIKSTETFWKEKQNKKDIYPVTITSAKNRVALVITNITFVDKKKNRAGAEKDEEHMNKLLTDLGFEVVRYTNLTAKKMDEALIHFSKHPKLKETDSVFVVIMSHGKRGSVLGVNFKSDTCPGEEPDELPIDNIYRHLNAENCPELVNKPKIIIIQACRGAKSGAVLLPDGVEAGDSWFKVEEDTMQYIHKEKDFAALLACTPDTVSYRHISNGSFLIQFTVEVLNTFAHNCDIEELFRKVMLRFEELHPKQMPTKDRCTLTRKFFLFPGLNHMN